MNGEKIKLSKENFSFVCPMKQDEMIEVNGGYFCDKCEEKVYDVSQMATEEYDILLQTKESICVTFKKVVMTSMAFGLVACSEPKAPKPILMGKIVPNNACQTKLIKPPKNNKLAPYKAINTKKNVEIAGGIMAPQSLQKKTP